MPIEAVELRMGKPALNLATSPTLVRILPFVVFAVLTLGQGQLGTASNYWIYLVKSVVGALLIWKAARHVPELKWTLSWEAVAVGIGVFAVWVGVDGPYLRIGSTGTPWNPHREFGDESSLAWSFVVVRIAGSSVVVPPIEELFYRSFLYRYVQKVDFLQIPLGKFDWKAFLITAFIFGIAHREWVAGILCASAYQGLVCWKGRLGDAVTAHAVTNFLLGLWVVGAGDWKYW